MSPTEPQTTRIGRAIETAARILAYGGGVVLVVIALVTVASVIGRALIPLGLRPIKGDFEMVEAGCAVAVFAFLPWCQLNRGHVTVDVFIDQLPARAKAIFGLIADLAVTCVAGLVMWRLWLGFAEKFPYGSEALRGALGMGAKPFFPETTYELELPVWQPYGLALIGSVLFFVTCLYTVWRAAGWVRAGAEP